MRRLDRRGGKRLTQIRRRVRKPARPLFDILVVVGVAGVMITATMLLSPSFLPGPLSPQDLWASHDPGVDPPATPPPITPVPITPAPSTPIPATPAPVTPIPSTPTPEPTPVHTPILTPTPALEATPTPLPSERPIIYLESGILFGYEASGLNPLINLSFIVVHAYAKWIWLEENIEGYIDYVIRWDNGPDFPITTTAPESPPYDAYIPDPEEVTGKATVMMIRPYGKVEGVTGDEIFKAKDYIRNAREEEYLFHQWDDILVARREGEGEGYDE